MKGTGVFPEIISGLSQSLEPPGPELLRLAAHTEYLTKPCPARSLSYKLRVTEMQCLPSERGVQL